MINRESKHTVMRTVTLSETAAGSLFELDALRRLLDSAEKEAQNLGNNVDTQVSIIQGNSRTTIQVTLRSERP